MARQLGYTLGKARQINSAVKAQNAAFAPMSSAPRDRKIIVRAEGFGSSQLQAYVRNGEWVTDTEDGPTQITPIAWRYAS